MAKALSAQLNAPLFASTVTRLLVDLNRSLGHPWLFSEFSKKLDGPARQTLLERRYEPYRQRVIGAVQALIEGGQPALHLAVHSFAPRLRSRERPADIGLLYDPDRWSERAFCAAWTASLRAASGELRVRRNYPDLGKADGFTTHLRGLFGSHDYLGVELEANQRLLRIRAQETADILVRTLAARLGAGPGVAGVSSLPVRLRPSGRSKVGNR